MKTSIKEILLTGLMLLGAMIAVFPLSAQVPVTKERKDSVVLNALKGYQAWKSVEYQGRVSYSGLPVQPSVKMYMQKDSLIQISVRVPLLGEVIRGEINRDEILLINKLNKSWCKESIDNLLAIYPGVLSDFQSLMLGRVVLLGQGEMDQESIPYLDIYSTVDSENMVLIPRHEQGIVELTYGYTLLPSGRTAQMEVEIPSQRINLKLDYSYGKGLTLDGALDIKGRKQSGRLIFDSVKWGGSPLAQPSVPSGYRRVGIANVFRGGTKLNEKVTSGE